MSYNKPPIPGGSKRTYIEVKEAHGDKNNGLSQKYRIQVAKTFLGPSSLHAEINERIVRIVSSGALWMPRRWRQGDDGNEPIDSSDIAH